ncbi:hypothetical protein BES34_012740 [Leptospira inadai serovar Lyme]|uniref:Uncharacterized protein n=1 Tax=Leptospira inadai serovar Lyme TaxID=293084 RepID=A0ABX4YH71_9LEPT|nr:hypothetical protein BES34_012740 [Leptospira inadai serovar Lyme]
MHGLRCRSRSADREPKQSDGRRGRVAFRGQKTEDRRVRFAHARQKLLDVGKVTEIEERSPVTQESFSRTWKFRSPMFCLQSSAM